MPSSQGSSPLEEKEDDPHYEQQGVGSTTDKTHNDSHSDDSREKDEEHGGRPSSAVAFAESPGGYLPADVQSHSYSKGISNNIPPILHDRKRTLSFSQQQDEDDDNGNDNDDRSTHPSQHLFNRRRKHGMPLRMQLGHLRHRAASTTPSPAITPAIIPAPAPAPATAIDRLRLDLYQTLTPGQPHANTPLTAIPEEEAISSNIDPTDGGAEAEGQTARKRGRLSGSSYQPDIEGWLQSDMLSEMPMNRLAEHWAVAANTYGSNTNELVAAPHAPYTSNVDSSTDGPVRREPFLHSYRNFDLHGDDNDDENNNVSSVTSSRVRSVSQGIHSIDPNRLNRGFSLSADPRASGFVRRRTFDNTSNGNEGRGGYTSSSSGTNSGDEGRAEHNDRPAMSPDSIHPLPLIKTMTSAAGVNERDGGDMETGIDDIPALSMGPEMTNDLRNIQLTFSNQPQASQERPNPLKHLIRSRHNFRALVSYGGYLIPINILLNVILLGRGWMEYDKKDAHGNTVSVNNPQAYLITSIVSLVLISIGGISFVMRCIEYDVFHTTMTLIVANFSNSALILGSAIVFQKNEGPKHPDAHLTGEYYCSYAGAVVALLNALLLLLDIIITPGFRYRGSGMSRQQRLLQFNIILLIVWIGIGGYAWSKIEGWDTISSVMFCMITVAAIGFGNIAPTKDYSRALQIVYGSLGILMFGMMLLHTRNVILQITKSKFSNAKRGFKARRKKIEENMTINHVKRRLAARPVERSWHSAITSFMGKVFLPREDRLRVGIPHWMRKRLDEGVDEQGDVILPQAPAAPSQVDLESGHQLGLSSLRFKEDGDDHKEGSHQVVVNKPIRADDGDGGYQDIHEVNDGSRVLSMGQEDTLSAPPVDTVTSSLKTSDTQRQSVPDILSATDTRGSQGLMELHNTFTTRSYQDLSNVVTRNSYNEKRTSGWRKSRRNSEASDQGNGGGNDNGPPHAMVRSYTTASRLSQVRAAMDRPRLTKRIRNRMGNTYKNARGYWRREQGSNANGRSAVYSYGDGMSEEDTDMTSGVEVDGEGYELPSGHGSKSGLQSEDEERGIGAAGRLRRTISKIPGVAANKTKGKGKGKGKGKRPQGLRPITKQLLAAITINLAFWCSASAIFFACERPAWSYFTALWFSYVAFATIGYGGITPATKAGQIAFICLIFVAVALETFLIISAVTFFSDLLKDAMRRTKVQKRIAERRRGLVAYEIRRHIKHPNYNPFTHDEDDRLVQVGLRRTKKAFSNLGNLLRGKRSLKHAFWSSRTADQRQREENLAEGFIRQATGMGGFAATGWRPQSPSIVSTLPMEPIPVGTSQSRQSRRSRPRSPPASPVSLASVATSLPPDLEAASFPAVRVEGSRPSEALSADAKIPGNDGGSNIAR